MSKIIIPKLICFPIYNKSNTVLNYYIFAKGEGINWHFISDMINTYNYDLEEIYGITQDHFIISGQEYKQFIIPRAEYD